MSSEKQPAHESPGTHGAAEPYHEPFDPEPAKDLAPDEPQTPLWLSALGLAIFVLFGLYLALGDDEQSGEEQTGAEAAASAAPPPAPTAVAPARPPNVRKLPTQPGVRADAPSPERREAIEQRLRQLRQQKAQQKAPQGGR